MMQTLFQYKKRIIILVILITKKVKDVLTWASEDSSTPPDPILPVIVPAWEISVFKFYSMINTGATSEGRLRTMAALLLPLLLGDW
jgi:hypothetical protein